MSSHFKQFSQNKINKMQNKIFIAAITATIAIASISSCKKEDHNHNTSDTEKPVITLTEPMMNDTISIASDVHIEFNVSDNDNLHDVAVNVTNAIGTNIFSKSAHVDAKTYNFHDHFTPSGITGVTPLTLKIDASDHSSNSDSKTVTFYVKP
jgi:hypothetical protein